MPLVCLGGDGTCSRGHSSTSDATTGEAGTRDRALSGARQCQDGGTNLTAGCNDGPHNGRSIASGGHSAPDRGDEHARRGFDG